MKLRLISGMLAAGILISFIFLADLRWIASVVIAFAVLAYRECDRLLFEMEDRLRVLRLSVVIVTAILCLKHSVFLGAFALWCGFTVVALRGVLASNRTGDFQGELRRTSTEWVGVSYVVGLLGFVVPILQSGANGREWLLLLFLIVFVGDSAAYFVGKFFGQNKLALRLSPKKTWEGSVGGFVGSLAVAYGWLCYVQIEIDSVVFWVAVSLTSILGQVGDLFESLLKRSQTQKDSGTFLPGHGGVLDRIDGLAFAAPFFYALLCYVEKTRVNG